MTSAVPTPASIKKKAAWQLRKQMDLIVIDFGPFWAISVIGHAKATRNACQHVLDEVTQALLDGSDAELAAKSTLNEDVIDPVNALKETAESVIVELGNHLALKTMVPTAEAAEQLFRLFSGILEAKKKNEQDHTHLDKSLKTA